MGTDLSALPDSREGGILVPSFSVPVAALPETNALNPGAWGSAPNRLAAYCFFTNYVPKTTIYRKVVENHILMSYYTAISRR